MAQGSAELPVKTPVMGVRELPEEIAARGLWGRCEKSFQVRIMALGSPAWVNDSPEMLTLR